MSPEAIDRRLRDLAQLHKLGLSLRDVKLVGKAVDLRRDTNDDQPRWSPSLSQRVPANPGPTT